MSKYLSEVVFSLFLSCVFHTCFIQKKGWKGRECMVKYTVSTAHRLMNTLKIPSYPCSAVFFVFHSCPINVSVQITDVNYCIY